MPTADAPRLLRVLHIEDSELDHELMVTQMRRAGLTVHARRVETAAQFEAALAEGGDASWDVILSDYSLPGFSGLVALEMIKSRGILTPFIIVSGEVGEDTAVEAMRNGAADYLLKNNLTRLVPAMLHAIEAHQALRDKRQADVALAQSQERLRELAQHLQTSVERERAAIAREIHDDVGGSLTALKFDLAWIACHSNEPAIVRRAHEALETVSQALESSKRIMHNLRPAILEQGLVAALQWMTATFEKRTGIETRFRSSQEHPRLPAGVPLVAYRTAQEALTNVAKHAQATRVNVDLTIAAGVLSLEVSDNGRGLSRADLAKARSFGIRGLHERASTVGGWVDLSSGPHGTTLILSVPLRGPVDRGGEEDIPRLHDVRSGEDPTFWGEL
ncbi:hybrid sensor histidine kinase/response regulator [Caldimonas manganoxidans]|uniref:hybrid sensor histidine kinase/response regulator n=1 Tax=Caldimonas manganoxidans TaxID=196015 RepID=UPI000364F32D|nr:response regulator [Caldimonas manganoxidans]